MCDEIVGLLQGDRSKNIEVKQKDTKLLKGDVKQPQKKIIPEKDIQKNANTSSGPQINRTRNYENISLICSFCSHLCPGAC